MLKDINQKMVNTYLNDIPANMLFISRILYVALFSCAIITWAIGSFVTNVMIYSEGIYLIFITAIEWMLLFIYVKIIKTFK